jgi:hypothetical protein
MRRICLLALLCACGGADTNSTDDTSSAYAAAVSIDGAVGESGFAATLAGFVGAAATGDGAATSAAGATQAFTPAGCATATSAGNVTTYTLTNCTGPYGLLKLNGTVTATFTPTAGGLQIGLASTGLKLSTATLSLAATIVMPAARTSAMVTSTTSAVSAHGETATHAGSYTASWTSSCLSLDGSFSTTIGPVSWTTAVSGFRQCSNMCPDGGGTVVITGARGRSVTVSYTNGGTAEVTTSGGTRGMIVLACGAV